MNYVRQPLFAGRRRSLAFSSKPDMNSEVSSKSEGTQDDVYRNDKTARRGEVFRAVLQAGF